jgi:hypothetical protein
MKINEASAPAGAPQSFTRGNVRLKIMCRRWMLSCVEGIFTAALQGATSIEQLSGACAHG